MLIKAADDKTHQINQLERLLEHSNLTTFQHKQVEQELKSMHSGIKGEKDAAYLIDFDYGGSQNWAVIHDLRIEDKDGRIAQIDHLLINRLLEFYVCESKNFCEGIGVNDHGECVTFFRGKPHGIPSPIEQNKRHISVLESIFKNGQISLPSRLGITLSPTLKSLILIDNKARINRPNKDIDGVKGIIKAEQISTYIEKDISFSDTLSLSKLISSETLENLAKQLAALHKPASFDFGAKFGIKPATEPKKDAPTKVETATTTPAVKEEPVGKGQKLICAKCGTKISFTVAKFCWSNQKRFDGKAYCMDCQKAFS